MSPSGLVYAVIVALWAAVLIPVWLRRHDDAEVTRSADRYSRAMRTLSRRPARIDGREMVMPRRAASRADVDAPRAVPRREVARPPASVRAASARLARRRLRSLLVLGFVTVLLGALAALGVVSVWAVVPGVVLLVVFVVHLRLQARRSAALQRRQRRVPARVVESMPSIDLSRAVVVETKGHKGHVVQPESAADADGAVDAESIPADADAWRPASWPLPTYVTKPKAIRPIRVIDLTTPGAWTSGRLLDDEVESAEEVVAEAHKADKELDAIIDQTDPAAHPRRRVVND